MLWLLIKGLKVPLRLRILSMAYHKIYCAYVLIRVSYMFCVSRNRFRYFIFVFFFTSAFPENLKFFSSSGCKILFFERPSRPTPECGNPNFVKFLQLFHIYLHRKFDCFDHILKTSSIWTLFGENSFRWG